LKSDEDRSRSTELDRASKRRLLVKLVRDAIALVIGGAVLVWTYRLVVWESKHPAIRPARELRHHDPARRVAAVHELEQFGLEDEAVALPALTGGLKDQSDQVRAVAAGAIATIVSRNVGAPADSQTFRPAILGLSGLLRDGSPDVRVAAADALASLPWASFPARQPQRGGTSARIVRMVTLPVDPQEAIDALGETLADPDAKVRTAAIRALGVIAPQVPYYHRNVPGAAVNDGIGGHQPPIGSGPADDRARVDRIVPLLLKALEQDESEVRTAGWEALSRLGPPAVTAAAVPSLIAAVASAHREVRYQAAGILARLKADARPAVATLIAVLNEPEGTERTEPSKSAPPSGDPVCAAATALGAIAADWDAADPAIAALTELARTGTVPRREAALHGLAAFGSDKTAIGAIERALGDLDPTVRTAAIRALSRAAERGGILPPEALVAALADADPNNRMAASQALFGIELGLGPFIPRVLAAVEHESDEQVIHNVAMRLELLGDQEVTADMVPVLMASLASQHRLVRLEAIGLLGRLGPAARAAIPLLIKSATLEADDPDTSHWNLSASRALGQVAAGSEASAAAIATLTHVLRSKQLRRQAQAAAGLAEFGQAAEVAIPDLIRLLEETAGRPDSVEWHAAAAALVRIAPGTRSASEALTALIATACAPGSPRPSHRDIYEGLWRFGPSEQVVSFLTRALEPGDRAATEGAITALQHLGPAARAAIPKLKALREQGDETIRQAADKALSALDAGLP
jgi:HEAT repeat protein